MKIASKIYLTILLTGVFFFLKAPFALAQGDRARLYGVNIIGLRRHGMDDASIAAVKDAWRVLFTSELPWKTALARVEETQGENAAVQELLAFLRTSTRGVCRAGFDT